MPNLKQAYQKRYGIKQPLRGYQRRAAKLGVSRDSFGLFMDPRLGKTRIDIAVTGYRFQRQQVSMWVVVCPAIAKDVWKVELRDTLAVPHEVVIIEGKTDERKLLLKTWKRQPGILSILIINHEATWRLKKWLYKSNPDKVTVDESQKIKNHAAKQSKALHVLARRAKYRTIMTGTPMAKPSDIFSQFKFMDDSIFGTLWKKNTRFGRKDGPDGFLDRYVKTWGFGGHKPEVFHRLDELTEKIAEATFQLTRQEAGGFPEELYQDITFRLTGSAARHYERMEQELKTMVNGTKVAAKIVLTQVLRLQQITGGFLPVRQPDDDLATNVAVGDDRIQALRGLLEEYDVREPIVIFARFRYEIEAVLAQVKRMGRSANFLRGGMKPDERDAAKWSFQDGKVDTCVVQTKAAGIAIDLSRADTGIFYSLTQSFIDYEQAKARIIAAGDGKKSILHLVARETVDDAVLLSNKERGDLARLIMKRYN